MSFTITKELKFSVSVTVAKQGRGPLDLNTLDINKSFSDDGGTTYRLDASPGWRFDAFILDQSYSGYGYPAKPEDEKAIEAFKNVIRAEGLAKEYPKKWVTPRLPVAWPGEKPICEDELSTGGTESHSH